MSTAPRSVLVVAGLWIVTCAAPSVDWLDGGNLIASAWDLGLAHPPGEAPWLVAVRVLMGLPLGDLAFRGTLLSILSAVALGGAVLAASRQVDAQAGGHFAVVFALLGHGAMLQFTRAEVYAPVAALVMWASVFVRQGVRGAALGGLLIGLAGGVHPLLAAATLPGFLLPALRGARLRERAAAFVVAAVVGLAWIPYLPLRATAAPERAWGVPVDVGRLVDVLTARGFATNFGEGDTGLLENLQVIASLSIEALVPALVIAAWISARGRAAGRLLAPTLWSLAVLTTVASQNKVFATNPDASGYLLLAFLPWAVEGGVALERGDLWPLGGWLRRLCLGGALVLAAMALPGQRRASHDGAVRWVPALLAGVPSGAFVMLSGNDEAFLSAWARRVEGRRPDVRALPRVLLGHEHVWRRVGPTLEAAGLPWVPALRDDPTSVFDAAGVPLLVQPREAESRGWTEGAKTRHGLLWSSADIGVPRTADERTARTLRRLHETTPPDVQAILVVAWAMSLDPQAIHLGPRAPR